MLCMLLDQYAVYTCEYVTLILVHYCMYLIPYTHQAAAHIDMSSHACSIVSCAMFYGRD